MATTENGAGPDGDADGGRVTSVVFPFRARVPQGRVPARVPYACPCRVPLPAGGLRCAGRGQRRCALKRENQNPRDYTIRSW